MKRPDPKPEQPYNVWLVEDNEPYRTAALRVVSRVEGVRAAHGFKSCEAALKAITDVNLPDVVLLDVGLPGMSGIEGIPRFKERAPAAQIIVLTVFDDAEKVFRAICAGADGYLLKSSSFDGIRDALAETRRGGAPMNGRIAKMVLQALPKNSAAQPDYGLTPREREILEALVRGFTKKEIADQLGVSFHTVDFHQRSIYLKLHVNNRTGAVAKALKERLA